MKGTATYNYNLGGFYATAPDFAILKIGKAVQNSAGQGNASATTASCTWLVTSI